MTEQDRAEAERLAEAYDGKYRDEVDAHVIALEPHFLAGYTAALEKCHADWRIAHADLKREAMKLREATYEFTESDGYTTWKNGVAAIAAFDKFIAAQEMDE